MVSDQVLEEVKDKISRGMGVIELKQQLLSEGWSDFDIEEAVRKTQEKEEEGNEDSEKKGKRGFFKRLFGIK